MMVWLFRLLVFSLWLLCAVSLVWSLKQVWE